jgi:prepilin-type N-terminal cleavage/methylation domain-containing protein
MHLRRRTFRSRGFTLMELLIVVAITGMLAALAIAGYLRYIHHAQQSEARMVMNQIRSGEEAIRAETLGYISCSLSLTDYYPNVAPDDTRWVWERSTDLRYTSITSGWAMLSVHPDAPVRYGYAVVAGVAPAAPPAPDPAFVHPPPWAATLTAGTPWFVVAARNSHVATAPPSLLLSTSYDGTLYIENDDN